MIEPVPELADGGFWYTAPAKHGVTTGGHPTIEPDVPGEMEWTATYLPDDDLFVIRSPSPMVGVTSIGLPGDRLAEAGFTERPHGRVRGA